MGEVLVSLTFGAGWYVCYRLLAATRLQLSPFIVIIAIHSAEVQLLATFQHWKSHAYVSCSVVSEKVKSATPYSIEECKQGGHLSYIGLEPGGG